MAHIAPLAAVWPEEGGWWSFPLPPHTSHGHTAHSSAGQCCVCRAPVGCLRGASPQLVPGHCAVNLGLLRGELSSASSQPDHGDQHCSPGGTAAGKNIAFHDLSCSEVGSCAEEMGAPTCTPQRGQGHLHGRSTVILGGLLVAAPSPKAEPHRMSNLVLEWPDQRGGGVTIPGSV